MDRGHAYRVGMGRIGAAALIAAMGGLPMMAIPAANAAVMIHSKCAPQTSIASQSGSNNQSPGNDTGITVYSPPTASRTSTQTTAPVQTGNAAPSTACAKT
jgi:hypothetical protein